MIKLIKIDNLFGIRKFEIDFGLKSIQEEKSLENQIIEKDKKAISLIPTFLAKNAAGKTSFIQAVEFALRFASESQVKSELTFYIMGILWSNYHQEKDTQWEFGTEIVKKLFQEISFAGTKHAKVEIDFINKQKFTLEISAKSFGIKFNQDDYIDLLKIMNKIFVKNFRKKSPNECKNEIDKQIKEAFSEIQMKKMHFKVEAIYRSSIPKSQVRSVLLKHKTQKQMEELIETFGFEATKRLLKKMDNNIGTISHNLEEKNFDIFLKNNNDNNINNDVPISAKSLSFGTQKIIEILAKSIKLFQHGGIMLIDEIENGLHLSLIKLIVEIYSNQEINKSKAQLVLTTHNPLIFDKKIVEIYNLYMNENTNFINVKNIGGRIRTEDMYAFVKSKNYYNELFWNKKATKSKSTLSNLMISQIINGLSEKVKWQS